MNHSLRYATHQEKIRIGMVAAMPHQSGRVKSAARPSTVKTIQKIFLSMG